MLYRLIVYVAMVVVMCVGSAHAATYWESTFDAQDCNWRQTGYDNSCLEIDQGVMQIDLAVKYAGTGSLMYYFDAQGVGVCLYGGPLNPPGFQCGGFWDRAITPASSRLWRRLWIRLAPNFVTIPPGTKIVKIGSNGNSDWLGFGANGNAVTQLEMAEQTTARTLWTNGYLQYGVWHCLEMDQQVNTPGVANGTFVMWMDGNLIANYNDVMWRAAGDFSLMDYSRVMRQNGQGEMHIDNYAVGDTRIGCGAAPPPPSDLTPPAQVTGVTAASDTQTSITYTWTANATGDGVQRYILYGCTGSGCTNFAVVGTVGGNVTTFTWNGRTANTLYRFRVAAEDGASPPNLGTVSSIVDETTDPVTTLPTVTAFTTTSNGGQITYTGTPTDFRIEFGGDFAGSTNVYPTLAQVPGGALSFVWPAGTNWACAHARDAVAAEDPIGYRCNSVQATTGGALRQHPTNGRWFTDDSGRAIYLAGPSGKLSFPNATRSALMDLNTSAPTDGFSRANSASLGGSWSGAIYGGGAPNAFKIVSNAIECSTVSTGCMETHTTSLNANQAAEVLIRNWEPGAANTQAQISLRTDGSGNSYRFVAAANQSGSVTVRMDKLVGGVWQEGFASATTPAWGSGDRLMAKAQGTTLTMYRNRVPVLIATNGEIATGGRAGLIVYTEAASTGAVVLDEFYAWNLSDTDPAVNDYVTAFNTLVANGLNYARLWLYPEMTSWGEAAWFLTGEPRVQTDLMPWIRTGVSVNCTSGTCVMVGRYNLDIYNQSFLTQVRQRVLAARERGLKVSIALFEGWATTQVTYHAFSSPFAAGNNEQLISCDTNANGRCEELHTLAIPAVTAIQDAYVKKLIDTLGDLDNIMWEIVNEPNNTGTLLWQDHIAETIANYESTKPLQHLIIQTPYINPAATSNAYLRSNSHFDVIVPSCVTGENYDTNPPVADGLKIEMYDSDHTGVGDVCGTWTSGVPWKTFLRGRHTISLGERETAPVLAQVEEEMAQTIVYANKVNLAAMTPQGNTSIVSTAYGLVNACNEYLMYMPSDGASTINLTSCGVGATFTIEYLNVTTSAVTSGGSVNGDAVRSFNPSGSDPMVVYLKVQASSDTTVPFMSGASPVGEIAQGTTSVALVILTDENATCKFSTTANVAYADKPFTFSTTGGTSHSYTLTGLVDGVNNSYYVRCQDVAGNANTGDYLIVFNVAAIPPDTTPPTLSAGSPTGVLAAGTTSVVMQLVSSETATCKYGTSSGIAYASMASTFNSTGGTTHTQTINGLSNGNTYTYYVRCQDAAGNPNVSDYTITWSVTASAPDVAPPIPTAGSPSGVLVYTTTNVVLSLTTDENATCKYGSAAGVAYASLPSTFSTTGGTSHSQALAGLTNNATYTRYVKCTDGTNPNLTDYVITWQIAASPDTTPPTRTAGSPSGVLIDTTTSVTMSLTTDENATCKYGSTADVVYASIASTFATTGTASHSQTLTGLTSGTSYTRYVRCTDGTNANVTDYIIAWQVATPSDTTAPIISGGQPNGAQVSGTTSVTVTVVTDKAATCKMDSTVDTAYASMATTFSSTGALLHTQSVGSLTDGNSYVRYVRCSGIASGVATTTDYPVAWSVSTAVVELPPADVTNVRGTLHEEDGTILWQWDTVSGAASYLIEISEGETFIASIQTGNTSTSYLQGSLTVGSYTARVKAVNAANQRSVNWSVSVAINATLPAQMTGLTEASPGAFSNIVILTWTSTTTNSSIIPIIERCVGTSCTDFAYHGIGNNVAVEYRDTTVAAGITYCYRGKFSNIVLGGSSAEWSSTYCATTRTEVATGSSITSPRTPIPFGQNPTPAGARSLAGPRIQR